MVVFLSVLDFIVNIIPSILLLSFLTSDFCSLFVDDRAGIYLMINLKKPNLLSEYGFQEVSEGMQLSTNAIFQKFYLILNNSNYSVILRECVLMYASVLMYIKHFQDLLKDNHNTIYF